MFRKVDERKRTYVYDGFKLTYENVIEVKISESGYTLFEFERW